MKDLKLELFNYRKSLTMDQEDVSRIIEAHLSAYDSLSEMQVYQSLSSKLDPYRYDGSVNKLLENFSNEITRHELKYKLKDLYRKVESLNQGMVYRHPMKVINDILNMNDEYEMKAKIVNELSVYDYVRPIKSFILQFTNNPMITNNINSEGGKAEKVFTVVEKVEGGHVAWLNDKWFYINEAEVEPTTLDVWFNETDKRISMDRLSQACQVADIDDESIRFDIDENLTIGISTKNGNLLINDEKTEAETTLESVFQSPMVPYLKKSQYYNILKETKENINKFVELDIALKLSNVINPFIESFVFNYKDNIYSYTIDRRYGNTFYKYESAVDIVNEMQNEIGYDLTYFYKDKFDKEVMVKRKLEDKEKVVLENLEEVDFNIDRINASGCLDLVELQEAKTELLQEKKKLETELNAIRSLKVSPDKELINKKK